MDKKYTLFKLSERSKILMEWVSIILICVPGIFYNCEPVNEFLKSFVFRNATELGIAITFFSVLIAILTAIVYRHGKNSDKLATSIIDSKLDHDSKLFFKGTNGIFQDVDNEIIIRRSRSHLVSVDVLGYTLFSVSTKFDEWKHKGHLKNIIFNLYHLDRNFILNSPDIDTAWTHDLISHLTTIQDFKKANKKFLKENKVTINLIPYSHIPAIHGFRLGHGTIYFSIACWDNKMQVARPNSESVYMKISGSENSKFATEIRVTFSNWIKKANYPSKPRIDISKLIDNADLFGGTDVNSR